MTWNDLVRKYIVNATDEECDYILWNKTPFPIVMNVGVIESYLKAYVDELSVKHKEIRSC